MLQNILHLNLHHISVVNDHFLSYFQVFEITILIPKIFEEILETKFQILRGWVCRVVLEGVLVSGSVDKVLDLFGEDLMLGVEQDGGAEEGRSNVEVLDKVEISSTLEVSGSCRAWNWFETGMSTMKLF